MPVVGDELAVLVLDRVQVADDLDAPAVGILVNLVVLGDAESERVPAAQLCRVGKFELLRGVRRPLMRRRRGPRY
jgi:hypothetical protein